MKGLKRRLPFANTCISSGRNPSDGLLVPEIFKFEKCVIDNHNIVTASKFEGQRNLSREMKNCFTNIFPGLRESTEDQ